MAIIRIAQFTDIHDAPDFGKTKAVANFLNSGKCDIGYLGGDFVQAGRYMNILQEKMSKQGLAGLNKEEQNLFQVYAQMQGFLAESSLEEIKEQLAQIEKKNDELKKIDELVKEYEKNQKAISDNKNKYDALIGQSQKSVKEMMQTAESDLKTMDGILAGVTVPLLGVAGNHDPGLIYDAMPHIKWTEKGIQVVKGIRFAGAPNLTQYDCAVQPQTGYYEGIEFETPAEQSKLEAAVKQHSKDEVYSNISPAYARLKNEKFDVLLAHKGFEEGASDGKKQFPFSIPLLELVKKNKAITLNGHIHRQKGLSYGKEYDGIRSSDQVFFVVGYDDQKRKLEYIDKYKWKAA